MAGPSRALRLVFAAMALFGLLGAPTTPFAQADAWALLRQPGPHFIAVGSLHLVGPRSIVEQLKAKGYRVVQN